jgi:hypothetical protein
MLSPKLDESGRRRFGAAEAIAAGRGGVSAVMRATGLARSTIGRGLAELGERLIGSIRRECLDHMVVFGEAHRRRILRCYARYYNDVRTHRSLDKDTPVSRLVQRTGSIKSFPILGGLTTMSGFEFSVHTPSGPTFTVPANG